MGKSAKVTKKPLNKKIKSSSSNNNNNNSSNNNNKLTSSSSSTKNIATNPSISHSKKRKDRIINLQNQAKEAKEKGNYVLDNKDYLKLYE